MPFTLLFEIIKSNSILFACNIVLLPQETRKKAMLQEAVKLS